MHTLLDEENNLYYMKTGFHCIEKEYEKGDYMGELNIGNKLQEFRMKRGMGVRELSRCANVTPSMLSQIERGLVNPSINTLKQIAQALDVPLFMFFKEDETKEIVVRRDQRKTIGHPEQRDTIYALLTPDVTGSIEFCMMTIPPRGDSGSAAQSHSGEEVSYVVEGPVEIFVDTESYTLETGDSIRIQPMASHKWINHMDDPATVIFAVTPPSF